MLFRLKVLSFRTWNVLLTQYFVETEMFFQISNFRESLQWKNTRENGGRNNSFQTKSSSNLCAQLYMFDVLHQTIPLISFRMKYSFEVR